MRVVAGRWKGHRLQSPVGAAIRPTTDRVKESMFNLLGPNYEADVVVDLFAGSGALGLEALSRGAGHCIFVDKHSESLRIARQNITLCHGAQAQSSVWQSDWRQALERIAQGGMVQISDLFLDPPYAKSYWVPVIDYLTEQSIVVAGAIVCEHPTKEDLPQEIASYRLQKRRAYGDISLSIYRLTRRDEVR